MLFLCTMWSHFIVSFTIPYQIKTNRYCLFFGLYYLIWSCPKRSHKAATTTIPQKYIFLFAQKYMFFSPIDEKLVSKKKPGQRSIIKTQRKLFQYSYFFFAVVLVSAFLQSNKYYLWLNKLKHCHQLCITTIIVIKI